MTTQELIKYIKNLSYTDGAVVGVLKVNREGLIHLIKQLDQSDKVVIPEYVARWIEYCKATNVPLFGAMSLDNVYLYNYARQYESEKLKNFFIDYDNQTLFASAWVNDYTVKKEKHYYIAVPVGKGVYNRVCIDNEGKVYLHSCGYSSIKNLIKLERKATIPITEEAIKDSPLSWAWQFAKELE